MNPRFPVLLTKFGSPLRATGKLAGDGEYHSGVGAPNILLGALKVARKRRFIELVLPSDNPVLDPPTLGTPASMRECPANRDIQRGQRLFGLQKQFF